MSDVVSPKYLAFLRGRRLFKEGAPMPENRWLDEEWNGPLNDGQAEWLGYMVERGITIYRDMKHREAVRDYIESGIDLPPDFA